MNHLGAKPYPTTKFIINKPNGEVGINFSSMGF